MAAVIRLWRGGAKKDPHYRIVVVDKRKKRDGKYIESLGYYSPRMVGKNYEIDIDKFEEWTSKGVKPSITVTQLVKRAKNNILKSVKAPKKSKKAMISSEKEDSKPDANETKPEIEESKQVDSSEKEVSKVEEEVKAVSEEKSSEKEVSKVEEEVKAVSEEEPKA